MNEELIEKARQFTHSVDDDLIAGLLITGAVMLVSHASRQSLETGWKRATGGENPRDINAPLRHAVIWAVLSGALVGVLRVLTRRGSQAALKKVRR